MGDVTDDRQLNEAPPDPTELDALWHSFAETRAAEARQALARFYLPFAKQTAAKLYARRTVREVEFEDYYQEAVVGLLEALDRFDPHLGTDFKVYAAHRIRGAILTAADGLTERCKQIAFRRDVTQERTRSLDELFPEENKRGTLQHLMDVAIGLAIGFMLQDSGMYGGDLAADPYTSDELSTAADRMQEAFAVLTDRERAVVEFHYLQDLRFTVIAEMMQLTRGRVSQLHASAIRKLRAAYEAMEETDLRI